MIDPGKLTHSVAIQNKTRTKDVGGGWVETWNEIAPSPVWCGFISAAERNMQRLAGGNATLSAATHIIEMHYHSGVTTAMRLVMNGRVFQILGVQNVDEADLMTRLFCEEVLSAAPFSSWAQVAPEWTQPGWIA